jgi:hypothetical protein
LGFGRGEREAHGVWRVPGRRGDNDLRVGDTRRNVTRAAASLASAAGTSLNIPGIPSNARFPQTLPTF